MLRSTLKTLGLLASFSFLVACGGDDGPDCSDMQAQMDGAMIVATGCTMCHSVNATDRQSAPENVNFDTPDDIDMFAADIRRRAIDEQTMPPAAAGGPLSADQISDLDAYLSCR